MAVPLLVNQRERYCTKEKLVNKCRICERSFSESELETHLYCHQLTSPFICVWCKKVVESDYPGCIERHLLSHLIMTVYKCLICGETDSSRIKVLEHISEEHRISYYECPYCKKGFKESNDVRKHVKQRNCVHVKMHIKKDESPLVLNLDPLNVQESFYGDAEQEEYGTNPYPMPPHCPSHFSHRSQHPGVVLGDGAASQESNEELNRADHHQEVEHIVEALCVGEDVAHAGPVKEGPQRRPEEGQAQDLEWRNWIRDQKHNVTRNDDFTVGKETCQILPDRDMQDQQEAGLLTGQKKTSQGQQKNKYHVKKNQMESLPSGFDKQDNGDVLAYWNFEKNYFINNKIIQKCPLCKVKCMYGHMKAHLWQHKFRNFKCILCKVAWQTKGRLIRHYYSHFQIIPYQCLKCDHAYKMRYDMVRHLKKDHQIMFVCPNCKQNFQTFHKIMKHFDGPCAGHLNQILVS